MPRYPSYVDLDPFIDVARLRALDGYVRERLQQRIDRERDLAFYTGPFVLREEEATVPGARMVALSCSAREEVYSTSTAPNCGGRPKTRRSSPS
jgi:hypothetical protein